jgi:flavin-dependent dehydrogenase
MSHSKVREVDVMVAGSGPIGCTFARTLVVGGRHASMFEAGAQHSARPGEHLKNALSTSETWTSSRRS